MAPNKDVVIVPQKGKKVNMSNMRELQDDLERVCDVIDGVFMRLLDLRSRFEVGSEGRQAADEIIGMVFELRHGKPMKEVLHDEAV